MLCRRKKFAGLQTHDIYFDSPMLYHFSHGCRHSIVFFLDPVVISQADISRPVVDTLPLEKREIRHLVVASDNSHVAIFYDDGLLWMGNLEDEKVWVLYQLLHSFRNFLFFRHHDSLVHPLN